MNKNILAIRERFCHMGEYSGYDLLFKFIETGYSDEVKVDSVWRLNDLNRIQRKILLKLNKYANGTPYYNLTSLKAEIKAFWHIVNNKTDILHISYIENNYGFGKCLKRLGNTKIIATVHQPPSWWKSGIANPSIVKNLDHLIVLDTPSKEYFSKYLDHKKIEIIRHGIDTDFFEPSIEVQETLEFNCLFAGQWMRNIELLTAVVEYIQTKKCSNIYFHIVHPHANQSDKLKFSKLESFKNTSIHSGLSDENLKNIYQQSHVFLIPLFDCTANNGILEAMACGLPIVTTPVGGVADYLTEDYAFLSSDARELGNHIIELSQNPLEAKNRGKKARAYAVLNLKWEVIAKEIINTYR